MQVCPSCVRNLERAATGGEYFTAENASELKEIYGSIGKHFEFTHRRTELTFIAVALGMVVMVGAGVLSTLWFNKLP